MRVFVTGATGFVGSAVVQELLNAGHQVLGLARSDASAQALSNTGAEVLRGTLEDLDSLKRGAANSDGVIHTAFIHDFSAYAAAGQTDQKAIEAIGSVLAGSERPFIVTSGLAGLAAQGQLATEENNVSPTLHIPRLSEATALKLADQGIHAMVMRLAASVHDNGDHGFVPTLIDIARQKGVAGYIGDGTTRWPAVHRLDAAQLYRLVLEKGKAGGRYHGVADEGIPMRDIATVIGKHLNLPVASKSSEEAADHFGWMARFASIDMPASSALTQQWLDWQPTHSTLLDNLSEGDYFSH